MKRGLFKTIMISLLIFVLLAAGIVFSSAETGDGTWIAAWGTGITETNLVDIAAFGSGSTIMDLFKNVQINLFKDVTFRTVIIPSASGSKLRLKLSNVYGKSDFVISRLTVAKSLGGSAIDKNSVVALLKGRQKIVIPAGKEIYTDEIDMKVTAMEPIAVSMYIGEDNELCNIGLSGAKTYFAFGENTTKDQTMEVELGDVTKLDIALSYGRFDIVPVLSSVDVFSEEEGACSAVVIGDSTVANDFPYYLAQQINDMGYTNIGVVGKGIMGNCLLTDGNDTKLFGKSLINRFDADALSQAGVKYVIVKVGANDIINPKSEANIKKGMKQPTYLEMKAGYQKLNQMCAEAGIKLFYIKITPWLGYDRDFTGYNSMYTWNEADWAIAKKVNQYFVDTSAAECVNYNKISTNPTILDSAGNRVMLDDEYTEDYFHPNDKLQLIWAQNFPISKLGVYQKPTKLTLTKTSLSVAAGESAAITAKVLPSDAADKRVQWTTSDKEIATVSSDGTVRGVNPGTAVITCRTESGGLSAECKVTVFRKVSGVELSESSLTLFATQTATLKAEVLPSDAVNKAVKFTSDDNGVATVSSTGKITAVSPGTCVITVKTSEGLFTDTCKVKVVKKIAVTKVSLNAKSKSVNKGKTYQLKGTVYPENASIKTFKWTSSDEKIATVSSNGLVTALKGGTATITCMSTDSGAYATCKISVKSPVTGVKLNKKSVTLYVKKTCQLLETVSPEDATSASVTWFVDDPEIASVTHDGMITAKKAGKTTVSCITDEGGYIAQCAVTVKKVVKVQDIELSTTEKTISVKNTYTLTPIFFPSNATNRSVKWSSSDKTVATVSSKGVVTGKKVGTCKITCTSVDGNKKAVCTLKVKGLPVKSVSLNASSIVLADGKTKTLKATVLPSDAGNKKVKWTSSNTKVASVSTAGKVTAQAPGSCTITCKTVSGGLTAKCKVTVTKVNVMSVGISTDGKTEITTSSVTLGSTRTLKPVIYPSNATNRSVKWRSNDPNIATVSSKGVVKGVSKGTTFIYCVTVDGGCVATCVLNVTAKTKVTGVKLSKTGVSLAKGTTYQLTGSISPSGASNKSVTWSTNNPSVATVSSTGKVTAKAAGKAVITVKTVDGGYTAKCTVTVVSGSTSGGNTSGGNTGKTQPVLGVKLDKTAISISRGQVVQLTATVMPSDATNKAVTWSSDNPKIALVGNTGKVMGLTAGTCTITVKTVDNSWKATCRVTVK